jgi:hypothetical protein
MTSRIISLRIKSEQLAKLQKLFDFFGIKSEIFNEKMIKLIENCYQVIINNRIPETVTETIECYYGAWVETKQLVFCDNPRKKHIPRNRLIPLEACRKCWERRLAMEVGIKKNSEGITREDLKRAEQAQNQKYEEKPITQGFKAKRFQCPRTGLTLYNNEFCLTVCKDSTPEVYQVCLARPRTSIPQNNP